MAARGWQSAGIEEIVEATPRVKVFALRPAAWRRFVAGQHLDFRLIAPDGSQAERSYSVTLGPERESIYEVAIELMPAGEVSPYFHEVAEPGDAVEIRGPFGEHFAWEAGDGGPLLLIGGGSGVAPLMSILRHRAARAPEVPATLVYAARTWEDLIFRDELIERHGGESGFGLFLGLVAGGAAAGGRPRGRLDAAALRGVLETVGGPPRTTFVCGSNGFVETVTGHAVDLGLPPGAIRTERFGGA